MTTKGEMKKIRETDKRRRKQDKNTDVMVILMKRDHERWKGRHFLPVVSLELCSRTVCCKDPLFLIPFKSLSARTVITSFEYYSRSTRRQSRTDSFSFSLSCHCHAIVMPLSFPCLPVDDRQGDNNCSPSVKTVFTTEDKLVDHRSLFEAQVV